MEQPPPYSPEEHHPPQRQYQGYEPLPNTDYPPQSTPYPPQQQAGYPPQKQYEGGYQNQGYPPQNPGYPPQGQGYIQHPAGFSSQTNSTTTAVVQNQPQLPNAVPPVFNDRITLSVIVWFCCCPLIGILAILKSFEAKSHYKAGDYAGAAASARTARNLSYAAIICGLILYSLSISLIVVMNTVIINNN